MYRQLFEVPKRLLKFGRNKDRVRINVPGDFKRRMCQIVDAAKPSPIDAIAPGAFTREQHGILHFDDVIEDIWDIFLIGIGNDSCRNRWVVCLKLLG